MLQTLVMKLFSNKNTLLRNALATFVFCAAITACETESGLFQTRKTLENETEIIAYNTKNGLNAQRTPSGLFYSVLQTKAGAQAVQVGDEVSIHYVAKRFDGVLIDSSDTFLNTPTKFIAGVTRFAQINAIAEVVSNFKEGDKVVALVPWMLRRTDIVSLVAPLYIPLRYDMTIANVRNQEEQIEDYVRNNNIKVTEKTTDGLRFALTQAYPDSVKVIADKRVTLRFTGRLVASSVVFQTLATSEYTIVDPAKPASKVRGFNDSVLKMRKGEKATVIIPYKLAYGEAGNTSSGRVIVPGYSAIVFDLEVLKIE